MNIQWYLVGFTVYYNLSLMVIIFTNPSYYFNGFYNVLNNPVLLLGLSKNNPQSSYYNLEYLISCLLSEDNSFSFNFTIRAFNRDLRDIPEVRTGVRGNTMELFTINLNNDLIPAEG